MKSILAVSLVSFLFVGVALAHSPRLPLGTVNASPMLSCPSGYYPGSRCFQAVVSCPNTADIQVTYGYVNPSGTPRGTIVFFNGQGGTQTYGGSDTTNGYGTKYLQDGYRIVQNAWATDWENAGVANNMSVKNAACRPATLLNYLFQNVYDQHGGMCAQGTSGGSGALGYALAWYGSSDYLDKAELLSGPVFGDIEQGCMEPEPREVSVCGSHQFGCVGSSWPDNPSYVTGTMETVAGWTGLQCQQGRTTSSKSNAGWKAMSIVDGTTDASFAYPQTAVAGWLCSNGQNNSAAEGQFYYENIQSAGQVPVYSVTRIDRCAGPEGVEAGVTPSHQSGFLAIIGDMEDSVAGCIKRH
jgi:hypothetical protein